MVTAGTGNGMRKILHTLALSAAVLLLTTGAVRGQEKEDFQRRNGVLPPLVSERYEYHDVCGCCEKDIQCDMLDKALRWKDGNDYDSITDWKITWDNKHKRGPDYCAADSFRVIVDIVIQLPRWVCSGSAPQSLKDRWDSFIKKLIAHENVHKDLARKAADDLTSAVAGMPPARTCKELDREVDTLCNARLKKLDEEQVHFDETSGHGFSDRPSFP
jgi:predicted secreted Zn-dependent protease